MSCLLVMADLSGSDCLSVEECASVFQFYARWAKRLVEKVAVKESDIIEKVAYVMAKQFPLSKETELLKCM